MNAIEQLKAIFKKSDVQEGVNHWRLGLEGTSLLVQLFALGEANCQRGTLKEYQNEHGLRHVLHDHFEDVLLRHLSPPRAIVAEDLIDPFLKAVVSTDPECDYDTFVGVWLDSLVESSLIPRRSDPLVVATDRIAAVHANAVISGFSPIPIYEDTETGFAINLVAILPAEIGIGPHDYLTCNVYAQVEFQECSELAFQRIQCEVCAAVRTVIQSGIDLLQQAVRRVDFKDDDKTADQIREDLRSALFDGIAMVIDGKLVSGLQYISDCIALYFAYPIGKDKDSIPRRVRNATTLLMHSETQQDPSVALSLSVAATEALLCRKGSDLANMFGENAATLLEPEPVHRPNAVKWCKKLYSLRSDVIHGSALRVSLAERKDAKLLAGAALKAIIERRSFMHRMGEPDETPDQLLAEMGKDKYTPGQLTGVEESPIVSKWRTSNAD